MLLLELGGVMSIIMSNADKLEICPFVKFIPSPMALTSVDDPNF